MTRGAGCSRQAYGARRAIEEQVGRVQHHLPAILRLPFKQSMQAQRYKVRRSCGVSLVYAETQATTDEPLHPLSLSVQERERVRATMCAVCVHMGLVRKCRIHYCIKWFIRVRAHRPTRPGASRPQEQKDCLRLTGKSRRLIQAAGYPTLRPTP